MNFFRAPSCPGFFRSLSLGSGVSRPAGNKAVKQEVKGNRVEYMNISFVSVFCSVCQRVIYLFILVLGSYFIQFQLTVYYFTSNRKLMNLELTNPYSSFFWISWVSVCVLKNLQNLHAMKIIFTSYYLLLLPRVVSDVKCSWELSLLCDLWISGAWRNCKHLRFDNSPAVRRYRAVVKYSAPSWFLLFLDKF